MFLRSSFGLSRDDCGSSPQGPESQHLTVGAVYDREVARLRGKIPDHDPPGAWIPGANRGVVLLHMRDVPELVANAVLKQE